MNFQNMDSQRKFILIASILGIISVFLPWLTINMGFDEVHIRNGFYDYGIVVFIGFIISGFAALLGNQTLGSGAVRRISTIAGAISLVFLFLFGSEDNANVNSMIKMGLVKITVDYGIWLAFFVSIAIIIFAWIFKSTPVDNLKVSNVAAASNQNPSPQPVDKIAELERLSKLKEKGTITEEEFKQLKSKIL